MTAAGNAALQNVPEPSGKEPPAAPKPALELLVQAAQRRSDEDAVEKEAAQGYEHRLRRHRAADLDQRTATSRIRCRRCSPRSTGPIAIAAQRRRRCRPSSDVPLDILVPTSGSADARLATEIALTLAARQQAAR